MIPTVNFSLLELERLIATVLIVTGQAAMHMGRMVIGSAMMGGGITMALIILSPEERE